MLDLAKAFELMYQLCVNVCNYVSTMYNYTMFQYHLFHGFSPLDIYAFMQLIISYLNSAKSYFGNPKGKLFFVLWGLINWKCHERIMFLEYQSSNRQSLSEGGYVCQYEHRVQNIVRPVSHKSLCTHQITGKSSCNFLTRTWPKDLLTILVGYCKLRILIDRTKHDFLFTYRTRNGYKIHIKMSSTRLVLGLSRGFKLRFDQVWVGQRKVT